MSDIVIREKCKKLKKQYEIHAFLPALVLIVHIMKLMKWNSLNNTKIKLGNIYYYGI